MNDNNFDRKKSTKSTKRFENGSHTKREFLTEDKKEDNINKKQQKQNCENTFKRQV